MEDNIYDYAKAEETRYQTLGVPIFDNWNWSMYRHIITTVAYKNSRYTTGDQEDRPFKNIIRPILNLQYRTEGFDLKDIDLYVDDASQYYKSFLIKKFHERWGRENGMDTFIDELVESYVDFGGALVKKVKGARPEVVPLQQIAFCDQTDIMSGPLGLAHYYSPDQLKEKEKVGWGKFGTTVDEVIASMEQYKIGQTTIASEAQTPGKYGKIYEIHGVFPDSWMEDGEEGEDGADDEVNEDGVKKSDYVFSQQLHIITYCVNSEGHDTGVTLYRARKPKTTFKLLKRDPIFGRALGFGGAEELFEAQVWLNYDIIRVKEMLDVASKMIFKTTDPAFHSRNKTEDMENGQTVVLEDGKDLSLVNNQPINITVFDNSIKQWEVHAQSMGSATDAMFGKDPSSGTPFKLQEVVLQEGMGLHEYRQGKIATFVDEIYMDWIIPYIAKAVMKDQTFLSELTLEELQNICENVVTNEANKLIEKGIWDGTPVTEEEVEFAKNAVREKFMKGGNKRFLQIVEDEMADAPIVVKTNIAGKQKDLAGRTDKLVNIFRQIISNPQVLADPAMAKLFNQILESSGLSPVDFSYMQVKAPVKSPVTDVPAPPATETVEA